MSLWYMYYLEDIGVVVAQQSKDLDPLKREHLTKISCRILTISREAKFPRIWSLFGWSTRDVMRTGSVEDTMFPATWTYLDGASSIITEAGVKAIWRNHYHARLRQIKKEACLYRLTESVLKE